MNPTVSVFVPTFNASKYLEECIDSLLKQTYPLSQIVICDDASTDGTQEIIRHYEKNHRNLVQGILHSENQGASANFNSGLNAMTGDLVSLIGGDDWWLPNKIEKEVETLLSNPTARWVYSDSFIYLQDHDSLRPMRQKYDGKSGDILYYILTRKISIRNWTAKKTFLDEIGRFDEVLKTYEDWDYKIRLASNAEIAHTGHRAVVYRRHSSGLSQQSSIKPENLRKIYGKHDHLLERLENDKKVSEVKGIWEKQLVSKPPNPTYAKYRTMISSFARKLFPAISKFR